jgi:hypothetical protein
VRLTLPEYWNQQQAALQKRSVVARRHLKGSEAYVLPDLTNPYVGFIDALVWFDDRAYLDVFEWVEIDEVGTPHRLKYSYHLSVDGTEVERRDFDPRIEDPALRHHLNRTIRGKTVHIPSERISLVQFVEQCWGLIAEERGLLEDNG